MNKLLKFEYIFFIFSVIYFTIINYLKRINSKLENDDLKKEENVNYDDIKIEVTYENKSSDLDVSGTYLSTKNFYNKALVLKHTFQDLWLFRYKETVSENEDNIFWIISNKNPEDTNEKNILFSSVKIIDLEKYYCYQFIDYGTFIDKGKMYDVNNKDIIINLVSI